MNNIAIKNIYIHIGTRQGEKIYMFNVTIINIKDIIKYLVSITLTIGMILVLTRYFSNLKDNEELKFKISDKVDEILNSSYLNCLDKTVPCIQETNEEINKIAKEDDETEDSILKKILSVEISQIDVEKNQMQDIPKVADTTDEKAEETKEETQAESKEEAKTDVKTEVITQNPLANKFTNQYKNVEIKNETNYELTEEMLNPNIEIDNKNILIFHTHTCESYTSSKKYSYQPTGTYRTTDLNYTVAKVGEELTGYLENYGYNVIHDTTYHDYPAYTGSYNRSLTTVENLLKSNKADVIIDLHRDAIGSNSDYAPTVKIGEEKAAQLMFVVGTNGGGLWHPNWNQNLKFAVKVQQKAQEMYPNLFKPIILRNSRYNQHLGKAATIIEVGATGNTLEQCLTSMKYLSKVMSEVMK
jgi:stage II sporulation protein P